MAAFFDDVERAQLSDLFDELGPQAPTILEPWTTRDLAAHLVLRERDYLASPGLVLPGAWSRLAEGRRRALALSDFAWRPSIASTLVGGAFGSRASILARPPPVLLAHRRW
jgi:hypothetical protein